MPSASATGAEKMRIVVKYDSNKTSTKNAGLACQDIAVYALSLQGNAPARSYEMVFQQEVMRSGHALIVIVIDEKAPASFDPQKIADELGQRIAARLRSGFLEVDVDFGKNRTGNYKRVPRRAPRKKRPDH